MGTDFLSNGVRFSSIIIQQASIDENTKGERTPNKQEYCKAYNGFINYKRSKISKIENHGGANSINI